MRSWQPCTLDTIDGVCGSFDRVDRYLVGHRCHPHRPGDTPDPDASLPPAPPPRAYREYGTATTDPLGRLTLNAEGAPFPDRLPRHECTRCPGVPFGHRGPHADR